jgi:hypothetical protein
MGLALWNPSVAIAWSWLFSPVFGSYIQMRNWQVLDEPDRAARARAWLYLSIGQQLSQFSVPFISHAFLKFLIFISPLLFFAVWYFSFAKHQRHYLKNNALEDYTRKSWAKVLTISVIGFVLYVCVATVIFGSIYRSTRSSAESAQADTNDERLGEFARFLPKHGAAAAPQDASIGAHEDAAAPAQPAQQVSVATQDVRAAAALKDYANHEFAFAFRYPASWIPAALQTPDSRVRFRSQSGMAAAECAVIVIRRPDIDNADQSSINAVFSELPSAAELKGALSQTFQAPEVIDAKVGVLGALPAHDVRVTYSGRSGTSTVFVSGRLVTTATPGHIWTLSCGGVGLTPAVAEQAYEFWEVEIERLITSFRFL